MKNSSSVEYVIAGASEIFSEAARFGGAQALLSDEELAKAARFRDPRDGSGFAAAHVLFRVMATRALHIPANRARELLIRRHCRSCGGPHGKPVIDGTNLSLSRVRDTVMVASGPTGQLLGADLEFIPQDLSREFDSFVLGPAERDLFDSADVDSRLRLWVAKEAVLKATGHGLAVAPKTLHMVKSDAGLDGSTDTPWAATVDSPGLHEAHGLHVTWVRAPAQHYAALASPGQPIVRSLAVQKVFEGR